MDCFVHRSYDLFLRNDAGIVFWLNVAVGKLTEVAQSETEFRQMSRKIENRNKLFAESDYLAHGGGDAVTALRSFASAHGLFERRGYLLVTDRRLVFFGLLQPVVILSYDGNSATARSRVA